LKVLTSIALFCLCLISFGQERPYVTVERSVQLMGTNFDITLVTTNREIGNINIAEASAEIERIDNLISSWDEGSETSKINANAGLRPVVVSKELFDLIERAKDVSKLTNGAFDISYAVLDTHWKFDGSMEVMPREDVLAKKIRKINYKNIVLDSQKQSVFLKEKGMRIGFGAIGKGYALDKAKELLISKGVIAGLINASGDITTWGTNASGEKWLLGIGNPEKKGSIYTWMPIVESSAATTVFDKRHVKIGERKYGHILDPKTGLPISHVKSVHVFHKSAEFSDALATAIAILGRDRGLGLVNQLKGTEVIIVDDKNNMYKSGGVLYDDNYKLVASPR